MRNSEILRKSIIDMAIQGNMLEQMNNELPFELPTNSKKESIIFKRGENYYIKKGNKEAIYEGELPFELPSNWRFAKIKDIYDIYTGDSIPKEVKEKKYTNLKLEDGYPYIGTKDVSFDHKISYDNGVVIPTNELSDFRIAPENCVLLCVEGGSAGKKIAVTNRNVCFGNKLMCFNPKFNTGMILYWYLQSPTFLKTFKASLSGIISGISKSNLENILMPIPPLEEQKRIVDKLNELQPLLEEYKKLEIERESITI